MISVVCNTYFILHLTWHDDDDDDDDDNDDEHLQTFFAWSDHWDTLNQSSKEGFLTANLMDFGESTPSRTFWG